MSNNVIGPIELAPDPVRGGDERHTLVMFLDYYRSVLARKAAGLDAESLQLRLGPSQLTLGGLLKHMALVEDSWFTHRFLGGEPPEPWATVDWEATPDWELESAVDDRPDELIALFDAAVDRSRAAVSDAHDLDALAARQSHGANTSLRWILVHLIEEYARHCGHADLLREAIDGSTGD